MELNLFKAGIKLEFQACDINDNYFLQEYLSINANTRLTKWKKLALKMDFEESEKLIFDLLLSLKEDIIKLESHLIKNQELLNLKNKSIIDSLNFEYLLISDDLLEKDQEYYFRFEINNHKIALFTKATTSNLAKIVKIKPEDQMTYDAFVVEIQRSIIRASKGVENE